MSGIEIPDLLVPVRSPLQERALALSRGNTPELTEAAVLECAARESGLCDFGNEDFRVRLRLWLEEIRADSGLSSLGRLHLFRACVRYATSRLQLQRFLEVQPGAATTRIENPLVICGLPRSGTTYLASLLSLDTRLRSLPLWEAMTPIPDPGGRTDGSVDTDERRRRAEAECAHFNRLLPYATYMHETHADAISEDVELQALDFSSYWLEWNAHAPNWRDYYLSHDQRACYRHLERMLQVLSAIRGPTRWLTKCPQHLEQLDVLDSVFPGAVVVVLHRDPVASIQSALTMLCYASRLFRSRIDAEQLARYWIDRYERLLQRHVSQRAGLVSLRLVDVEFRELVSGPAAVIARIYGALQLPLPEEVLERLRRATPQRSGVSKSPFRYDLRRDFGRDPAEVRAGFNFYRERFPVELEVG